MKVVFTQAFWFDLDSVDDAADIVHKSEPEARKIWEDNIVAAVVRKDADLGDLEGQMGWLGTSFWVIDEDAPLLAEDTA